ncbi:MAG: VCBS repeat-containing protein [Candidatus Altiarchaeota archaeon]|nr:VCBS repeat-containing protein [Candidatus Altiarchaeota archaeon]
MKSLSVFLVLFLLAGFSAAEYLERECLYQRDGSYIMSVYAGDLKGDGVVEIFAGSDNGVVMDFSYKDCGRASRQWSPTWQYNQKVSNKGSILDMGISDFEKDGKNDLFVAAKSRDEYLFLLSNIGNFRWADEKAGGLVLSMDVANLDDDALDEIIIGNEGNVVAVIDGETVVKWKTTLDNPVYFVKALDLDDDGSLEVVALTNRYMESASVYVLNANGGLLWNYSIDWGVYQASDSSISVGDLDGDNMLEIAVATYKKGVIALDHDGSLLWDYPTERLVNSVHISGSEVIFSSNPYLYFVDASMRLKSKIDINGSALIIQRIDLEGDGSEEVLLGMNRMIQVIGGDGVRKGSWDIGKSVGALSMYPSDLDGDGRMEIIAGYGWDEARLDKGYKAGELIILKVTGGVGATTTTTVPSVETTTTTRTAAVTTSTYKPAETTTLPVTTSIPSAGGGINLGLIFLFVVIMVVVFAVLAVIVFFFFMKGKKGEKTKEEKIIDNLIEEKSVVAEGKKEPSGSEVAKEEAVEETSEDTATDITSNKETKTNSGSGKKTTKGNSKKTQ